MVVSYYSDWRIFFCILTSYVFIMKKYKRGINCFLKGKIEKDKHKFEGNMNTNIIHIKNREHLLQKLEKNLNKEKAIWKRKGDNYCFFHGIFFSPGIKGIISVENLAEDKFRLLFSFYDVFPSLIMSNSVKKKYTKKMNKILKKLTNNVLVNSVNPIISRQEKN